MQLSKALKECHMPVVDTCAWIKMLFNRFNQFQNKPHEPKLFFPENWCKILKDELCHVNGRYKILPGMNRAHIWMHWSDLTHKNMVRSPNYYFFTNQNTMKWWKLKMIKSVVTLTPPKKWSQIRIKSSVRTRYTKFYSHP